MSIDFGNDIFEDPLVSTTFQPEDSGEVSLRPHTLKEYIGQTKAKEAGAALAVLGYSGSEVAAALKGIDMDALPLEEIIRQALKRMAK